MLMDELRVANDDVLDLDKGTSGQSWFRRKAYFIHLLSAEYWLAKLTPNSLRILVYFFLLIVFGVATSVTGRYNQRKFGSNYAWFNSQFTTLAYCVMVQIVVSYKYFFTNHITDEMKAFPWWKFFLFGLFDGLAGFLFAIGAPNTPATLQNIISQMNIPVIMLVSFVLLRSRYGMGKIVGAGVILAGAFIALIPVFTNNKSSNDPPAVWYSILIFISYLGPQALASVAKERAFGQVVLDVYYVGAWVAWNHLAVNLFLLPATMIPGFGGISPSEIPDQIQNGYFCLLGWNTQPGDSCENTYVFTGMYIFVNFGLNISILLVIYTLHFVMYQFTEDFNWETIVSLVVVLGGFAVYSTANSPTKPTAVADEESTDLLFRPSQ